MKKKLLFSACACMAVVLGLGCSEVNGVPSRAPSGYPEGPKTMVDAGATAITRTLYENLFVLAERGTMFGQQIPTLYGLDNNRKWWAGDDTDLSDTKYLTGSHPAVCGWELSNIELDMETNIDGELFTEVRKHIIAAFGRGRQYDFVALRQSRFGRKFVGRDARRLFDHSGRREPRKVQRLARQGRRFHAEPQVARRRAYSADLPPVA